MSKVKDVRASCYYHVSDWNSNYVINQNVLLDQEKQESYRLIKDADNKLNYAKSITTSNLSVLNFYKRSVYDFLADQYSIALQEIDVSNIEFYIEVTNPDVNISNSTKLGSASSDIPSSYTLFRIDPSAVEAPIHAYTNAPSATFTMPGGFGAYVLRERVYKSSLSTQDTLSSRISSRNIYQSYPFKLSVFNSYAQSTESPTIFTADWSAEITATYDAVLQRQEFYREAPRPIDGEGEYVPDKPEEWSDLKTDRNIETEANQTEIYALSDDRLNGNYRAVSVDSGSSRNNYIFTRDVNNGNTYKNYKVGQTGMLAAYVAYIQITLREAKLLNSSLAECPLTKVYDKATSDAVLKFQQVYKARIKDGIVDSETKSLFTREVWKKMFQTDNGRYVAVVDRIKNSNNSSSVVFIENAATVAEIWELKNTELSFQKISYTGTSGPLEVTDTIFVAIPERYRSSLVKDVKIHSVNIYPGTFRNAPSYKGISIQEVKAYPFDISSQQADYTKSQILKSKTEYFTIFNGVEIEKPLAQCGVVSIKLKGGSLGGLFGPYAEGYAIDKITFVISYKSLDSNSTTKWVQEYTDEITGYIPTTVTKPAIIKYKISGKVENISPNKTEVIDLSGVKSVKYTTEPLSITYPTFTGSSTINLTTTRIDFSSTEYSPPFAPFSLEPGATPNYKDESIKIDLTSSKTLSINPSTLQKSNVLSGTRNPINESSISVTLSNNKLFFETSSLIYQNSTVIKSSTLQIQNYWLLKTDGSLIQKSKNSISVLDGLLLLCQPSNDQSKIGKPFGINLQAFASSNSSNAEVNIDYGAFILDNDVSDNGGFIYGFYDRLTKEFIGKTLYYVDLISRGADNVYIGVLATDADGNLGGGSDFFGPKTFGTILPPSAPIKLACPVYHATYIPSSRISLSSMPPNLSKLDPWPVYVTAGSFVKEIYIDPNYGWTNWFEKYTGKTIKATYSTLEMENVLWSQILGQPYIDIINEYPVFLSSKKIQLSQVPIASFVEPSSNKIGVLKQYLFIETRKSKNDSWDQLEFNYIRNVNCSTGIVDLLKPLPQDEDLVRVSYAVRSNGIPIKQVNGSPIPINPFLNKNLVEPEKPLYIYIKPLKVEIKNYISSDIYRWDNVPEYIFNSPVHFTYDSSIFNKYESSSFDITAVQIGLVHVMKNTLLSGVELVDLRVKGGGLKSTFDKMNNIADYGSLDIEKVLKETKEAISFWDVYPPNQQAYPNGGFVIIKLPKSVLNNFSDQEEVYSIIRKNITAGVVFKIQDMEGNDWGTV